MWRARTLDLIFYYIIRHSKVSVNSLRPWLYAWVGINNTQRGD